MAIELTVQECAEQPAHDIDELVRRVEQLDNRLATSPWVTLAGVGLMAFVCCVTAVWVLLPLLGLWWLLGSAGLIAFGVATVAYMIGRRDGHLAARRIEAELGELLQLIRQAAPALVQQGKLSELRWATIKIQLSRYGI